MAKQVSINEGAFRGEAGRRCLWMGALPSYVKVGRLRPRLFRRLSVRRSVSLALILLVAIAAAQLVMNLQAMSSAAFMLRRAETSYRQLSAYQQLSIDVLEYMLARKTTDKTVGLVSDHQHKVETDLRTIDGLETLETGLVRDNGGDETNIVERARLANIRSAIERIFASENGPAAAEVYHIALKPLMRQAIDGEQTEIGTVEQAMGDMQARITWFGRFGILIQIVTVGLILLLVTRAVLDPISRLVSDIREFGRDRLGHRVDVPRHDEFGLLAQHINRMARHLDRGRQSLVAINDRLETIVAERTGSLQEKNNELRRIDESRRQFFADVSHELRTPLTAIVGEADITLRVPQSDAQSYREALSSILANSTYLNRRIDDLMALARSSDGKLELESTIVDLNIVATEAMAEIRSLARVNSVIVRFEPLRKALLVQGDSSRLRQCLMILLDNAVKFSRAYQVIELVLVDRGSHADLTVIDQGKGIALEELPLVFDRFYQTAVGRRMGGTGLGLSIAQRIVEAHNGLIVAKSSIADGTAISITLPLKKDQEP